MINKINGVILAGGLSSRFGSCKTKLRVYEIDVLRQNYDLLLKYCDKVVVSCKADSDISDYPCIYDDSPIHAPIFGICSALEYFKSAVLVLSCDLPFMNDSTIKKLIEQRNIIVKNDKKNMTTFCNSDNQFIESLVAIYEYKSIGILMQAIENKEYSLHKIFSKKLRHDIIKDMEKPFFNINYKQDLERAKELAILEKA